MSAYDSMTIAELRHACKERGVRVPAGARKADLAALLSRADVAEGVEEVRAEVVDDGGGELAVTCMAGSISANFDALEGRVDSILAQYDGWQPSPDSADDLAQVRQAKSYLKSLMDQVEARRKAVKREYMRPLEAFDTRAGGITRKIKAVRDRLSDVEREANDQWRARRRAELEEFYEGYAGLLAEVVPYDRVHEDRWLNKTCKAEAAKQEIQAKVDKVAHDRDAVRAMGLEFEADALRVLYSSLDLGEAVRYAQKLSEDRRRVDAMEEELAGREAQQERQEAPQQPPQAYQPPAQAYRPRQPQQATQAPAGDAQGPAQAQQAAAGETPEALVDRAIELSGGMVRPVLQAVLARIRTPYNQDGSEPMPCVAVIGSATQRQMDLMGRCIGGVGCSARFYWGDFEQAYQAWLYERAREMEELMRDGE